MTELAVDEAGNSGLPLLVRTPNSRVGAGANRDRLVLNPDAKLPVHLRMFRFLGVLIGVAIRTDCPMDLPLAPWMWELIVGLGSTSHVEAGAEETLGDARSVLRTHKRLFCALTQVDAVAAEQLSQVATMAPDVLAASGLECVFPSTSGVPKTMPCGGNSAAARAEDPVPLCAGSDAQLVTLCNRASFVAQCLLFRAEEFSEQAAAVRKGVAEVITVGVCAAFTGSEFNRLVCGQQDFEVARLRRSTHVEGFRREAPQVQWFWKTLDAFLPAEKSLFLRFVGGITRLPHDIEHLPHRFEIHKLDGETSRLPEASTCFFTLKLPEYETEDELRAKLHLAMTYCAAIDTDGVAGNFEVLAAGS